MTRHVSKAFVIFVILVGSACSSQAMVSVEKAMPFARAEVKVPSSPRPGTWGVGRGSKGNPVSRPSPDLDEGRTVTK